MCTVIRKHEKGCVHNTVTAPLAIGKEGSKYFKARGLKSPDKNGTTCDVIYSCLRNLYLCYNKPEMLWLLSFSLLFTNTAAFMKPCLGTQSFLGWTYCTREGVYLKGILATYAIFRGHR